MDDSEILNLYFERNELAILKTQEKYGSYCYYIAYRILSDNCESEECVNDTYLNAWNSIPPQYPKILRTYLGRITRNISLNRLYRNNAEKRGGNAILLSLDEIEEFTPAADSVQRDADDSELSEIINRFLGTLTSENRKIFMRRYWYLNSVKEIAKDFRISEGKVKMSLHRSRNKLRKLLEKEGISI
ncbi:MAG: RNA polymerase sigma factor [Oscillospiraceae bacterium]